MPRLRGGARYLLGTASILRDSKGNLVGAIEIIRDITDRKRAEIELRESEEKLRLIFESAFDGISIYEEIPGREQAHPAGVQRALLRDGGSQQGGAAGPRATLESVQRNIVNACEEADRGIGHEGTGLLRASSRGYDPTGRRTSSSTTRRRPGSGIATSPSGWTGTSPSASGPRRNCVRPRKRPRRPPGPRATSWPR